MPALVVTDVFTVSVELAEPPGVKDTLDGLRVELRPEAAMALRETMPVKPVLLTKILAVADPPASKLAGEPAAAVMVKLAPTLMTTSVERMSKPLAPVTVILYEPAVTDEVTETVIVEVPEEPAES